MQYIDIVILTEIGLDDTFPIMQLLLSGFFTVQFLVSSFSEP